VIAHKSIRAQDEGGNGWLKGIDTNIDTPRFRLARGRVAQTILIALGIAIANLRRLEQFMRNQQQDAATLLDYLLPNEPAASASTASEIPPEADGTGGPPTG
jgi:hypothetical protein